MAKHTWALLNLNEKRSNKLIYRCITCYAQYVRKSNDKFDETSNCNFSINDTTFKAPQRFNLENFSGVYISEACIDYVKNGMLHRDDGPAKIYKNYSQNKHQYYIDNKNIEDVNSIEEALIKNLLE